MYVADSSLNAMSAFKQAHRGAQEEIRHMYGGGLKPKEAHRWNPYSFEGGTVAAIAGADFAVIAGDTRMTQNDVTPISRDTDKVHMLSNYAVLATAGFYGDAIQMRRLLQMRMAKYQFNYRTEMSLDLLSEMLARNLYYNRFFPLYTGAILAGLCEDGSGGVFSYDPVGCIERLAYTCSGSAISMIEPFLDSQIGHMNIDKTVAPLPELTLERAVSVLKDAFRVATEREICTGDKIQVLILQKGKEARTEYVMLRED